MMRALSYYLMAAVLLALCAAGATAAAPAPAPEPAAAGFILAVVDMDKVFAGYEAYKQASEQFRSFALEVERQVEMNRRLRLLEDNEVQELKDLRAAAVLTPEQKMRLQQLEGLSDAREQEYNTLNQKTSALTPEESARMEALVKLAAKRAQMVAAEERRLTQARQKKNEEMSTPFDSAVRSALEKVAKQHRVSMILTKEVVLWAALDLTEEILAELNHTAKPPARRP